MATLHRNSLFFLLFISLCISACQLSVNTDLKNEQQELMKVDSAFSAMSATKGMNAAFLAYMDSNGVLLRPHHFPIVGHDARKFLEQTADTSFSLTWAPTHAILSKAADLGYTFGVYLYKDKDTTTRGTYVSIWKKQPDGEWKFVLDTGNPGVGEEK